MALPEFPRARLYPSNNYNARPPDKSISAIVLHATVGEVDASLAWLTNPHSFVSTHYLIDREGAIYQLVPEPLRAWHAGPSSYDGLSDWNNFSIGIELVNHNDGVDPYDPRLMESCRQLCRYLVGKYAIRPEMIVTHLMISGAITGKSDPRAFPLQEFVGSLAVENPAGLRVAAWKAIGVDFNPDAMFQIKAKEMGMGRPVSSEARMTVDGVRWAWQAFESGILACIEGDWQNVRHLDWFG